MAITEVLQGCGSWSLSWARQPPRSVRSALGVAPTVLVFGAPVQASAVTDSMRVAALFEGIATKMGTSGISGWEPSWLVQKPNGDGQPFTATNGDTVTNVRNFLGYEGQTSPYGRVWVGGVGTLTGSGITSGDLYNTTLSSGGFVDAAVNVSSGTTQWGIRTYLDGFVDQVSTNESTVFSWRINPGLAMDVDKASTLYRQLDVVFSDTRSNGYGGEATNVYSVFDSETSIEDSVYRTQRLSSDGTTLAGFSHSVPDPFVGPDNAANNSWRLLPSVPNDTDAESFVTRAAESMIIKSSSSVTAYSRNMRSRVGPGDYVYRHDPNEPVDDTVSITHFGKVIHPVRMWVNEMTWSPTTDMSVIARTPAGVFVDITRYVTLVDPGDSVRVGMSEVWQPAWTRSGNADVDRLGKNDR